MAKLFKNVAQSFQFAVVAKAEGGWTSTGYAFTLEEAEAMKAAHEACAHIRSVETITREGEVVAAASGPLASTYEAHAVFGVVYFQATNLEAAQAAYPGCVVRPAYIA